VDFTASALVNQFDYFGATIDLFFKVTVDYTPFVASTIADMTADLSCLDEDDGSIEFSLTGAAPFSCLRQMDGTQQLKIKVIWPKENKRS
jgi:hypothetical protein